MTPIRTSYLTTGLIESFTTVSSQAERHLREVYDSDRARFVKPTTLRALGKVNSAVQGFQGNECPLADASQHSLYQACLMPSQYFVRLTQTAVDDNGDQVSKVH